MKVQDIMTREPTTCPSDTTLDAAVTLMWQADCGILPVVDDGRLVGVVTDRDMVIALGTRDVRPSQMPVGLIARTQVVTCAPGDDIHAALAAMKRAHVRRVPVVGAGARVLGILSIDGVVLAAGVNSDVRNEEVVDTLRDICETHHPVPRVVRA